MLIRHKIPEPVDSDANSTKIREDDLILFFLHHSEDLRGPPRVLSHPLLIFRIVFELLNELCSSYWLGFHS